ncbi:MAG TPA: 23S rRNA (pseudouridine(1915)-N(3))-methyltransferase RlmH [bacterium]
MRIFIFTVGETRASYLREAELEYARRLRRYCRFESGYVAPEKMTANKSDELVMKKEGERLSTRLPEACRTIALDRLGKSWTSQELATHLSVWQNGGLECVGFVIGGPLGLSPDVLKRADDVVSLSRMTLAHEIAKLVLLEQLYRAFTILRGEKYHK